MVNYGNGKIYKLVNNCDGKIYVGSTCSTLSKRKGDHKSRSKKSNYKVYQHLNKIGWDNVEIILIEKYECKCKDELHARERHWIDELKPELNKVLPKQTQKEWRETPERKAYRKQYLQREDLKCLRRINPTQTKSQIEAVIMLK